MTSIANVMAAAVQDYGAEYRPYNQYATHWDYEKAGVCVALCKVWLRLGAKFGAHEQELSLNFSKLKYAIEYKQRRHPNTFYSSSVSRASDGYVNFSASSEASYEEKWGSVITLVSPGGVMSGTRILMELDFQGSKQATASHCAMLARCITISIRTAAS